MRRRLLIVDDEEAILLGMGQCFRMAGYDVDCAREREEAEALLAHCGYDCAIVDLCLTAAHGADGLDVIAYARARSPSTRIVVLTAYGSASTETEALSLEADAFLRKPQSMDELLEVVDRVIGGNGEKPCLAEVLAPGGIRARFQPILEGRGRETGPGRWGVDAASATSH